MVSEIQNSKHYQCPVEANLEVIGGKWKPIYPLAVKSGKAAFFRAPAKHAGYFSKMLTKQLRELEEDGLISGRFILKSHPKLSTL